MDGVAVIRALMVADADLTALVPASRIVAGVLPINTPLDALAITRVSAVDDIPLAATPTRHVDERVQVTAFAATYPRLRALLRAVKHAAANYIGTIAGLENVTAYPENAGPDFMDEQASIYMASQDFSRLHRNRLTQFAARTADNPARRFRGHHHA